MSIIDADFPSGSVGLYGSNVNNMLDGRYVEITRLDIAEDPDPDISGNVLEFSGGYLSSGVARATLPSAHSMLGLAARIWLPGLPTSSDRLPNPLQLRNASNSAVCTVRINTDGSISAYRGDAESGTLLGTSGPGVILANAWQHIEIKMVVHDTTGSVEVRVRGRVVLLLENQNTGTAGTVTQYVMRTNHDAGSIYYTYYMKDIVIWDDAGSENNDFLGEVSVFYQQPISTIAAGGWVSNAGADADETVDKPRLANVLTAAGAISSGNQVRINSTYYNWTSGSVDTGAPAGTSANPWLVAMGASTAEAIANMYAAIGASGTPGVTYSTALTAHTTVTPFGLTDTALVVVPTNGTTISMTFSETGANTSWLSTSAFQMRVHDDIRMSVDYIPAVAATGSVTFSGLPIANETVTVNGQVYVFKAAAAGALEVTIGADADATGTNFAAKVNSNSTVVTAVNTAGVVALTAVSAGAAGNSITLAEAATNTAVSGATLSGGVDVTYPDPFEVRLAPLPDDVTSIKAVIPLVRAAKIDGGDGKIQVSFGTSDPSYDAGPDTVITTAFTYWGNVADPFVSEINPDTGVAWAAGEFNIGARMKVARTL